MSKELALTTFGEIQDTAKAFAASGMFSDVKSQSQAIVRIMAGKELGLGPFAAMRGINIIKGNVALNSGCMASRIKASEKYDYRIKEITDKVCTITFLENGKEIGESTFTIDDGIRGGTKNVNYKTNPRNMLFARAVSNGAKWYCPDVFNGSIYSEEEAEIIVEQEEIQAELQEIDDAAAEDEERMRAANAEKTESEKLERAVETGEYILEFGSKKGQPISKVDNGIFLKKHLEKYGADMSEYALDAIDARIIELREDYREKLAKKKAEEQAAVLGAGADLEAELEY